MNPLWRQVLAEGRGGGPDCIRNFDWRLLSPLGDAICGKGDWKFESLMRPDFGGFDLNSLLNHLPGSNLEIIEDVEIAFDYYASTTLPYSWKGRVRPYLLGECRLSGFSRLKTRDVIDLMSSRRTHLFMELVRVTLLMEGGVPCVVFECRCPVEEYLSDYGFCFTRKGGIVEYASEEECWKLRVANGGDV